MKSRACTALFLIATIAASAPAVLAQSGQPVEQGEPDVPEFEPAFPEQTRAPAVDSGVTFAVERLAEPLEHPWGIDVLPDGGYLVTERPGRLRVISEDGEISEPVRSVPEVVAEGQGGLLDVRVGPTFNQDRVIYWTYAKPLENGSGTAAARGRLSEDRAEVSDVQDIFVQEPPSPVTNHYGSRILFDGQGHAFITTGEHFDEDQRVLAQDVGTTYGKVVRVNLDGSIPEDNPVADQEDAVDSVWSLGHRNIQGAAFHPESGELWVVEHGPQGGDELNRIKPGANYGWPVVSYGENYDGSPVGEGVARHSGDFVEPRYYWDPVIAPGGMIFYQGGMFADWQGDALISSLVPGAVVRLELDGETVTGEERLLRDEGRIRDIVEAPDGALLVLVDDAEGAVLRLTPGGGAANAPQEVWRARGFDRPESVVHDPERDALYLSNVGAAGGEEPGQGYISRLGTDGEVTEAQWVTGLNGPKGMAIHDGRLYVSDIDRLVVIDIEAGEVAETHEAPRSQFLNDVTADRDGRIFVSDMRGNAIYVLDDGDFSVWLEDEALMQPNGLLAEDDRLVVAAWGEGEGDTATLGHLKAVDYDAKTIRSLGDGTPVGNLDGIEAAGDGSYLVTDWVAGALWRIRESGASEQLLDLNQGSADLAYRDGLALIPMMMDGELRALQVD